MAVAISFAPAPAAPPIDLPYLREDGPPPERPSGVVPTRPKKGLPPTWTRSRSAPRFFPLAHRLGDHVTRIRPAPAKTCNSCGCSSAPLIRAEHRGTTPGPRYLCHRCWRPFALRPIVPSIDRRRRCVTDDPELAHAMALAGRCMRAVFKLPTGHTTVAGEDERAAKARAFRAGKARDDNARLQANADLRRARGVLRFVGRIEDVAAERYNLAIEARFAVKAYERGDGTKADVLGRVDALAEFLDQADDARCVLARPVNPAPAPIIPGAPTALSEDARKAITKAVRSRSQLREAATRIGDDFWQETYTELTERHGPGFWRELDAVIGTAGELPPKSKLWKWVIQAADAVRKRTGPTSADLMNRPGRVWASDDDPDRVERLMDLATVGQDPEWRGAVNRSKRPAPTPDRFFHVPEISYSPLRLDRELRADLDRARRRPGR